MALKDEIKKAEADAKAWEATVEAWFQKHFHGSRIAADTDSYNIAHAAKEDLKTIVPPVPVVSPTPAAPATTAA